MATLEIPINSNFSSFDFQVDLEGIIFTLDFSFNFRRSIWYMAIYDQAKENLILGDVPCFVNFPLTNQYVCESLPPGRFILINEREDGKEAGQDNFGTDVKMFYVESE